MSPEVQTVLALLIVAIALVWLVVRAIRKRRNPGCGTDCGAVSADMRKLQKRLRNR